MGDRDLRDKLDGLDLRTPDVHPQTAWMLGRVIDGGSFPTGPDRYYLVAPVTIEGHQVEGETPTLVAGSTIVPVAVIGKKASVGEDLICQYSGGRWVARRGGGPTLRITVGWLWMGNVLCRPVAGATVNVWDEHGELVDSQVTDENGVCLVTVPDNGRYTIRAMKDGYTDCGMWGVGRWAWNNQGERRGLITTLCLAPASGLITDENGQHDAPLWIEEVFSGPLFAGYRLNYQTSYPMTTNGYTAYDPPPGPFPIHKGSDDTFGIVVASFSPWTSAAIPERMSFSTGGPIGTSQIGDTQPPNRYVGRMVVATYVFHEEGECPQWVIDVYRGSCGGSYSIRHATGVAIHCDRNSPVVLEGTIPPEEWCDIDFVNPPFCYDISACKGPITLTVPS